VDTADFNQTTDAPVNHQLRLRPFYDDLLENDSDQLKGFLRYDLLFPGRFEEDQSLVSNIGNITFTLQGINRYMHEAKLEEEERIRANPALKSTAKKFDVKWFQSHMSFHGILNSDKSEPTPWGSMEKTVVVLTQGMTRMPSCFPNVALPPCTRLAFLVKEVCVRDQRTTYVTNVDKNGVTLPAPSDGYVTRVIPIAHDERYLKNYCSQCGMPDETYRAVFDNCSHKDHMLAYEKEVTEAQEEDYFYGLASLYEYEIYKTGKTRTIYTDIAELKDAYDASFGSTPKVVKRVKTAHYIPFAMTEQGLDTTVKNANIYRPNSEINESQYQLNAHEEIWLRAD
jgi:hypothetical protein